MDLKRLSEYVKSLELEQAAMDKAITTLLDSYNSNTLWEMARAAQLPHTTGKKLSKGELLALMQQEFFKPKRLKEVYQHLTRTERDVLNRLLLHEGKISSRQFKRQLLRAGVVTEAPSPPEAEKPRYGYARGHAIYGRSVPHIGSPSPPKSTIFEDVLARLTLKGLVFSAETEIATTGGSSYKLQLHPAEAVYVPAFVSRHLPPPEPIPVTVKEWQPSHTLPGDPQLFLRDLYLYWDTVRRSPVDMIQVGFVGKRGLKQLNAALLTPDPTLDSAKQEDETSRLYLLRQLLQALKLLTPQNGILHTTVKNSRAIPDFWQRTTAEQVTAVLAAWRTVPTPFRFNTKLPYYQFEANTRLACHHLLNILTKMPAAAWTEREEVLTSLQEQNSSFLFNERGYIESGRGYYYGNQQQSLNDMDKLEQRFVAEVAVQFLLPLGLVELGYNNPPTNPLDWYAYRLTSLGTAVLHQKPFSGETITGQIIIQPNFQILAMGPVPLSTLAQLDLFAERQKVDRSAFEYHLSRQSVYAAQQMGYPVAEIERFLEAASPHDLPQNIRRSLAEWAAHHDRIVFRRHVTLLQAADEALLERLLNGAETGKLLARPVSSQVALVKSKQQEKLVSALQAEGLLPAISGPNPEAADKSVLVAENGRIEPVHAVPSLHLQGRLAPFTVATEGGWQLTAQSVARAGGSKQKVQAIVDELGKLNRGQLSQGLVAQIRAWGGYYGRATVGTMTLFEFRDQETLAELRDLPELTERLQPFDAGKRALAVVAEEEVTAVRTILSGLGVAVSGQ